MDTQPETGNSVQPNGSERIMVSGKRKWKLAGVSVLIFGIIFTLLSLLFSESKNGSKLGVVLATPLVARTPESHVVIHSFPDTIENIHVFNDQLATWDMSEAQFAFAAAHYAGTQKVFASDARRLRAHNPNFVVLNYRLGLGLGYQHIIGDCEPGGTWLEVIEGEKWVREYPDNPPDEWFYKYDGQRVLFCEWGWYLMDLANPAWREYWVGEVLRQLRTNKADGIFVDGLFPPNHYGSGNFKPKLPVVDPVFEKDWSSQIEDFIVFGQSGDLAEFHFIPNVGYWLTGRDSTDYSGADGVFVEGFGRWTSGDYFSIQEDDWQLQMDRILGMINQDKIVMLQQYVDAENWQDHLFLAGNYLLIKGNQTYLNLEFSTEPEWFPVYEIPIGRPVGGVPSSISTLWRSDWEIYARAYTNGLVLVNPSDVAREVRLPKKYYLAVPSGGGIVPVDGDVTGWEIEYFPVDNILIAPNRAAVLLVKLPGQ
ncbi:MAG: putative glycoside hydrolase [Anaerolineaceae bacterium]